VSPWIRTAPPSTGRSCCSTLHGRQEEVVLEHDAKHRLLVERLRGDGTVGFSTPLGSPRHKLHLRPRHPDGPRGPAVLRRDLPCGAGLRRSRPHRGLRQVAGGVLHALPPLTGEAPASPRVVRCVVGRSTPPRAPAQARPEVLADTPWSTTSLRRTDAEPRQGRERLHHESEELRERRGQRRGRPRSAPPRAAEEEARRADKPASRGGKVARPSRDERSCGRAQTRAPGREREPSASARGRAEGQREDERQRRERAERLLTAGGPRLSWPRSPHCRRRSSRTWVWAWICAVASVAALRALRSRGASARQ